MKTIWESIYNQIVAEPHNAFYDAVAGRVTYGKAIEGCASPYAVFFGLPSFNTDTFGETIDDGSFQVNIYSNNYIEAGEILKMCRVLFDGIILEVVGYRDVTFIREMSTQPWQDEAGWVASIEFSFHAQPED